MMIWHLLVKSGILLEYTRNQEKLIKILYIVYVKLIYFLYVIFRLPGENYRIRVKNQGGECIVKACC